MTDRELIALLKLATKLTPSVRKRISTRNFAIPERAKSKKQKARHGNYPIHDREHARAALGLVGMHGTPEEKKRVREAVCRKYPDMCPDKKRKKEAAAKLLARLILNEFSDLLF